MLVEMLEDRRLLAAVPIERPGETIVGTQDSDQYVFDPRFDWNGTRIEDVIGGGDVLDFSAVREDLTFRIKAQSEVQISGGGRTATSQNVSRFKAGQGNNVFIVENGASLRDGAIEGFQGATTILAFAEPGLPGSGSATRINVALAGPAPLATAGNVEFVELTNITRIIGGRGSDVAIGDANNNVIEGGRGDDHLRGDDGNDSLWGNDGDDRIFGDGGDDPLLDGGDGEDVIDGGQGSDVLRGGSDDDQLIGGEGNDDLAGGDGDDLLRGDAGNDTQAGGLGDDQYLYADGWGPLDRVSESSGEGSDVLDFSAVTTSLDVRLGGQPADEFVTVQSGTGDRVNASNHFERIVGGDGPNTYRILDRFASDYSPDGLFNDTLVIQNPVDAGGVPTATIDLAAFTGNVAIEVANATVAASGNLVTITFASGKQIAVANVATVSGSKQQDVFTFKTGASLLGNIDAGVLVYADRPADDQRGRLLATDRDQLILLMQDPSLQIAKVFPSDLLEPDNQRIGVQFTAGADAGQVAGIGGTVINVDRYSGGARQDYIFGKASAERLVGRGGSDGLFGKAGSDQLDGESGTDYLDGGADDDTLRGGSGDDILVGGSGNDTLIGGRGADTYLFQAGWGQDTIVDSGSEGRSDTLDFSAVDEKLTFSFSGGKIEAGTGPFDRGQNGTGLVRFQTAAGTFRDSDGARVVAPDGHKIQTIKTGIGDHDFLFDSDWESVTIDISGKDAADLVKFDFGGATESLRFDFKKAEDGSTFVEVINLGTFSPINALKDDIPGLSAPTVKILGVDQNTTIISGRHENSYRVIGGAEFPGTLVFTSGARWSRIPFTETSFPSGIRPGHRIDLTRPLGVPAASDLTKQVVNLQTYDAYSLFGSNIEKNIQGIGTIAREDSLLPPRLTDISFGSGINLIQGDTSGNDFQHKALRPGLDFLSGLTGPDTYRFGNLWGAAAVVEVPDLTIAGQPLPESLDTLDFSAMAGNIEVDVYTVNSPQDAIDAIKAQFSDGVIPQEVNTIYSGLSVSTNLVFVKDTTFGSLIADVLPDNTNDSTDQWLRGLGTSFVAAMDIESLVGPRGVGIDAFGVQTGNITVRLHGDATLRGTVTAGSLGSVTLDYSEYGSKVIVDAGAGNLSGLPEFEFLNPFEGLVDVSQAWALSGGSLIPGAPQTAIGSATGIEGNRLGGLTTLAFGDDNIIGTTLKNRAVVGLARVIGSPFADTFSSGPLAVDAFRVGAGDKVDGIVTEQIRPLGPVPRTTLDLFDSSEQGDFVVALSPGTVTRDGVDYATATGVTRIVAGRGNDRFIGSDGDETFVFRTEDVNDVTIGWGVDTIEGGGGRDRIDISAIPGDWSWSVRTETVDSQTLTAIYFVDGNGTELPDKVLLSQAAGNDFTVLDREGIFSGSRWIKNPRTLSAASQSVSLPSEIPSAAASVISAWGPSGAELASVPGAVVEAAIDAFDGKTILVPRTDGSGDESFVLSVDRNSFADRVRLLTDRGGVLVDSNALTIRVVDLPDGQISSRLQSGEILIDSTAADFGWHLDPGSMAPAGRVDLTSVLIHELAQQMRLDDAIAVMQSQFEPGVTRRDVPATFSYTGKAFVDTPLAVSSLPPETLTSVDTAVNAIIDEAVARWNAAELKVAGNPAAQVNVPRPAVQISHLPARELARTLSDGTIVIDPTAAGHFWFLDDSPETDDDVPSDRIDLLTVIMHELGHAIGVSDENGEPGLMNSQLATGQRSSPPTGAVEVVTIDSPDQTRLTMGLSAFGGWVGGLGERLEQFLTSSVDIPFVGDVNIAGLFGIDAGAVSTLTQDLRTDVISQVEAVFAEGGDVDGDGVITNMDIAAKPNIDFAPSSNDVAFVATLSLPNFDFSESYELDFSQLRIGGFDPATLGLRVTSDHAAAIDVFGGIDLNFVFGLDSAGQFYVESPTLVASLQASNGDQPIDIDVALGPFGLSIDGGTVSIGGQMSLGTDVRLDYDALLSNQLSPSLLVPTLSAGAGFDIDLPLTLTGALSGINRQGLAIRASGEVAAGVGSLQSLIAGIELETPGLSDLFDLRGVGLDQILDAVIAGLDALVDEDPSGGSLIARKLPGINQSAIDLFGDGTADFISNLKNAIEDVRSDSGSSLGNLAEKLNLAINGVLGFEANPFTFSYQDSTLLIDFAFEKVLVDAQVDFEIDLRELFLDDLQSFIDTSPLLESVRDRINLDALDVTLGDENGQIKLTASGSAGVDFGFGFDLSDVTNPVSFLTDDSEVFVGVSAALGSPVDLNVQLDLAKLVGVQDSSLGTIGFLIDNATAGLDVRAAYGLADATDDGRYELSSISADDLEITVDGAASVDLPLYLTPQFPVGGTTQDRNADGFADHVLHIGMALEQNAADFQLAGPGVNELLGIAALLNDPGLMLRGLEQMFDVLQSDLDAKFNSLGLPLVGDAVSDAAGFVGGLRDDVLGPKNASGVYSGNRVGQRLQSAIDSGESVIDVIRQGLFDALGAVGGAENLLRVPVLDASGNPTYDTHGKLILREVTSPEDIGITIGEDGVQFNVVLSDTVFQKTLPLSFDASAPGLGLSTSRDSGLNVELSYVFGLGFGLSAGDLFYVDTSGVTDSGSELSLDLSATVTPGSELEGQLGFSA